MDEKDGEALKATRCCHQTSDEDEGEDVGPGLRGNPVSAVSVLVSLVEMAMDPKIAVAVTESETRVQPYAVSVDDDDDAMLVDEDSVAQRSLAAASHLHPLDLLEETEHW